VILADAV